MTENQHYPTHADTQIMTFPDQQAVDTKLYSDEIDVAVDLGEWSQASGDETIGSFGVGPCIALAVYNPDTHEGFVGHSFGNGEYTLEDMLKSISDRVQDPGRLQAWLTGGEIIPFPGEDEDYEDVTRENAVKLLWEHGIPDNKIRESWVDGGENDNAADIVLDCSTGTCTIAHYEV